MTVLESMKYAVENKAGKKSDLLKHISIEDITCIESTGHIRTGGYNREGEETWKATKRSQELYDILYKPLSPAEIISNFIAHYIFRLDA